MAFCMLHAEIINTGAEKSYGFVCAGPGRNLPRRNLFMTRSINIIQQPDCYRTYNKKTHVERAGPEIPAICLNLLREFGENYERFLGTIPPWLASMMVWSIHPLPLFFPTLRSPPKPHGLMSMRVGGSTIAMGIVWSFAGMNHSIA